ncbi:MAG: CRISPR-associated protein Csx3 [Chloroflexota bacterium]|nr:CRISPR-associated protein Csx3 [Chloroflexota bacterium]
MATRYPAIFVGGPPNSGKSWLPFQLSRALKRRQVIHYVLRAHPDGEGHWRYEAPAGAADELRRLAKAKWTPEFAQRISRDIANRHLPLLVDAGGKVSEETRQILAQCTGAILIASSAKAHELEQWRALVAEQALPLLADLHSTLDGPQAIDDQGVTLRGTISGLGQDRSPHGSCFELLLDRLDGLCRFDAARLVRAHAALIDDELLNIEAPIGGLAAHSLPDNPWLPHELPQLLAGLDARAALAVYGAGPSWLYAALSAFNDPLPIQVFNVALGWVVPPTLMLNDTMDPARLLWELDERDPVCRRVRFRIPGAYLDYDDTRMHPLAVPPITADRGVVLDGRLPSWLYAALARPYTAADWIGVYEPRAQPPAAVIIRSNRANVPVGSLYPLTSDGTPASELAQ